MRIESYEFIQTEGTDPKNPNLRGLEIKPANLPYKGKIASLSAQDRWMKMFEVAADSVSEICKPSKVKSLKFGAAELDYNSVDNDPRYPTYIQASFQCQ